MSFFGVELNAQVNKLILNIRLTLGKNKYNPNFRTIYRSFIKYDPQQSGYVSLIHFEKALNQNGIFFKKFQWQVFQKAWSSQQNGKKIHWFSLMSTLRQPMNIVRQNFIQEAFSRLDTQHQGKLHYSVLMSKFNAQQIKQYKLGFKTQHQIGEQFLELVPLTTDGYVTRQQFVNFYNDLSSNNTDDNAFIRFVSKQWQLAYNQNIKVQPQDVKSAIKLIRFKMIQKTQGTHQQFILKQLFNQFDVNKNNVLSLDQLQKMLVKLEIPIQQKFTKQLLNIMDHNGNGYIDFNEFKNFLFHQPYEI